MRDILVQTNNLKMDFSHIVKNAMQKEKEIDIIGKYPVETGDFQLLRVRGRYSNFKQCTKCKEYHYTIYKIVLLLFPV